MTKTDGQRRTRRSLADEVIIIIMPCVDDVAAGHSTDAALETFLLDMESACKLRRLGPLSFFLGAEIDPLPVQGARKARDCSGERKAGLAGATEGLGNEPLTSTLGSWQCARS